MRCAIRLAWNFAADLEQALAGSFVIERLDDRIVELGLDLSGQALRSEERIPSGYLEFGEASLFGRWQVLDEIRALWAGNGHGFDCASLDLGGDSDQGGATEIDLAPHQIIERRTAATIGDTRCAGAHDRLKERAGRVHD